MAKAIIDLDSGEILKELPESKKKKNQEVTLHKVKDLEIPWNTKMFAKLFINQELPEYSKDNFILYWLKLSRKLAYTTNVISKKGKGNDNYTPLTDLDIMEYLDISERTWLRFIKESLDKGVIAKDAIEVNGFIRTQYVLNPIYSFNGSNINYYTFELFKYDKKFNEVINQNQIDIFNMISKHKFGVADDMLLPNKEDKIKIEMS